MNFENNHQEEVLANNDSFDYSKEQVGLENNQELPVTSFASVKEEQVNQDSQDLAKTREELFNSQNQEQSSEDNYQKFKDLANVRLGEQKLQELLNKHLEGEDFTERAKSIVYEMLTRRSDFIKQTNDQGLDVVSLMKNYQPQMAWYREMREKIASAVDRNPDFKWNSNPGWFGLNTRPELVGREGVNIKVYKTIPVNEYSFIQNIPDLAKQLRVLSLASDDVIQIKFPASLSGFLANNDSLVIHFKKAENQEKILDLVNTWSKEKGITNSPREMGRTEIAADSRDTSFSDLVAKNIADWLAKNADQYDHKILTKEAIKHAISQSQKPPIIKT
jgi:hypothetical protein